MSRRRVLLAVAGAAVLAGLLAWCTRGPGTGSSPPPRAGSGSAGVVVGARDPRGAVPRIAGQLARGRNPSWFPRVRGDGMVEIAGTVVDAQGGAPVGGVEVVLAGARGEHTTQAAADGGFALEVPVGSYRAYVRDDRVLSVGRPDVARVPDAPTADTAGMPDEALMPLVVADRDRDGIDLAVTRSARIHGQVRDRSGRAIAGAALRARGRDLGVRPVLGSDQAETDAGGRFELRVPPGAYGLEATHARFAGNTHTPQLELASGEDVVVDLTLVAGCVISGRVVGPDGAPRGDGALERRFGPGDLEFTPTGTVAADGTFRWITTDDADVVLRAWPWQSPPSPARRFACADGARHDGVVFQLPRTAPDISGTLVDASGAPVPYAFVDLAPFAPDGIRQQERTDARGRWEVYQMPAGRYQLTAAVAGRGIAVETVTSPQRDARIELRGSGRIEGTTTLASGSFEVSLDHCFDGGVLPLPLDRRLVSVRGGRFAIDHVPACDLQLSASYRGGAPVVTRVSVPPAGSAEVALALGPPHKKQVDGVVRDRSGRPIAGAVVTGTTDERGATPVVADASGRFSLPSFSGATLVAVGERGATGQAIVGMANVDREQLDIVLAPAED